jgi:alpha-glucoside transport system substrate-binding protein
MIFTPTGRPRVFSNGRVGWNRIGVTSLIAVSALVVLSACGNSSPVAEKTLASGASCTAYSAYKTLTGKSVTMFTSILDPELSYLKKSWADFETCTGITINIEGSNQFEALLPVRVKGGNAPDIAVIPQPGLLAAMAATGKMVPASTAVLDNVTKYWSASWKALGSVNGTFYAAPMSANMKSLVWYSPTQFKKNSYTIPTTWAQMTDLANKMAANGQIAFCGGIGSGGATGWPATDWLEEVVVRMYGATVYNDWISHKVKFSDPKIIAAMKFVAGWMQNPKWVGNVASIATTTFQQAGLSIPTDTGCQMLQQASFYGAQFPAGTKIGPNGEVSAFYLPGINSAITTPIEGGGEFLAAFSSRAEVSEVLAYLSSSEWATSRVKVAKGWVSANNGVPLTTYKDPIDLLSATYLADPKSTFVFDASDAMPAAVGAGSEWTQLTAWFAEGKSIQAVATAIDASWPAK